MTDEESPISDAMRGVVDPSLRLVSTRPRPADADLAREYRERLLTMTTDVIKLLDDAKKQGMRISWQISPPDSFGRHHLLSIDILKEL